MNAQALADLKGELITYSQKLWVIFQTKFSCRGKLQLKLGAQVMFVKTIYHSKNYFNGKMGIIKSLSSQEILVHFPEENKTIEVDKYEWQNIRYKVMLYYKVEEEVWELLCIIPSS
jgi:ATP-dependent exoDNAse (exonuclease V) alpha subunit